MFPQGSCVWPAGPLLGADLVVELSWRTWRFHSLDPPACHCLLPDFLCSLTRHLTLLPGASPTWWTVKPWTVSQRPSVSTSWEGFFITKKVAASCYTLPALSSTVSLSISRELPFLAKSINGILQLVAFFVWPHSLTPSFQGLSGTGSSL